MLTLPFREERQEEWKYILQTAHNNNLPVNLLIRQKQRIQRRTTQPKTPTTTGTDTRWATFTYTSPQIRKLTNLFKHTNVKIAFKSNNTISQLTKPANKTPPPNPKDRSRIYSLTCNTCQQSYVGQTSRSLRLRFQEHTRYIKHNNPQSAYAQPILHNQHEYGPMDKTMTLLKPLNNTSLLAPYEQFFIHSLHKEGKLISEQNPGEPNPILQLAIDPSQSPV